MLFGLIADTHGYTDPKALEAFQGADRILHAGDVGSPDVLTELETVAPVTAVLGNMDWGLDLPEREIIETPWGKILLQHKDPWEERRDSAEKGRRSVPSIIVHGHTHRRRQEWRDGVLFINPGAAGLRHIRDVRSVALLELGEEGPKSRFVLL